MQGYDVQQSTTAFPLVFLLISSTDHITGLTGATVTVTLSKSGGAFASPSGAVSEIANGWYKVAGNATDTATLGPLALHATATGADPSDALYPVVSYNPQSTSLGLSLAKTTNITGFNDIAATAIVSAGAITTSSGAVSTVTTVTSQLTAAAIATGVWTDTTSGDFTTLTSPGKIIFAQLGGAFSSTSSSVFSTASLANAPTGGSAPTASAIATAVWTDLLASSDFSTSSSIGILLKTDINAQLSTLSTYAGGPVASVTAPVTAGTVTDKTGYSLASTGLNAISVTATTGLATTFPAMLVQVWRRFFKASAKATSGLTIKTFADDGTTVLTTQAYTDDGAGNETLGAGS